MKMVAMWLSLEDGLSLLKRMGYVKHKASTKTEIPSNEEFEQRRQCFLLEISGIVRTKSIPEKLVLKWTKQASTLCHAVGKWTLDKAGSHRVEVVAQDDRRQITATFTSTLSFILSIQARFPANFDVWHSPNHWANQETAPQHHPTLCQEDTR